MRWRHQFRQQPGLYPGIPGAPAGEFHYWSGIFNSRMRPIQGKHKNVTSLYGFLLNVLIGALKLQQLYNTNIHILS